MQCVAETIGSIKMNGFRLLAALFLCLGFNSIGWSKNIVIGVEEIDYYPYYHLDDAENYQGFARDLFDTFGKLYGHRVSYRPLPIKRLYREFLDSKVDFKFPDNPFWGKEEKQGSKVLYSDPVVGYVDGVLVKPKYKDIPIKDLKSVGFVRGFSPWTLMEFINKGVIKPRKVNSLESLIRLTTENRIDGAYFNVAVANYLLAEKFKNKHGLVFAQHLPNNKSNYRISSLAHTDILEQLKIFLVSSEAVRLRNKYKLGLY